MKKIRIAIIQFPGSNCEQETKVAVDSCKMEGEIFRWNRKENDLEKFDGYIIGGGFSYQDRIRAGVIAAKEPIMEKIAKEAGKGKPVLGICNGAQILVESGLVPGIKVGEIEMALSRNVMEKDKKIQRSGYWCKWSFLKHKKKKEATAFSYYLDESEIIPMPIAHAEGRFITKYKDVLLKVKEQVLFSYCTSSGEEDSSFPINPNGSIYNSAGICNKEGNILSLMPHPERANYVRQIPLDIISPWQKKRIDCIGKYEELEKIGPGSLIFHSMRKYIQNTL